MRVVTCGSPGLRLFCRERISTCSGTRGTAPWRNSFISPQRCRTLRAACSSNSAISSGVRSFFLSRADNDTHTHTHVSAGSSAFQNTHCWKQYSPQCLQRGTGFDPSLVHTLILKFRFPGFVWLCVGMCVPSGTASEGILNILLRTLTSVVRYSGLWMPFVLQSSAKMVVGFFASRHLL